MRSAAASAVPLVPAHLERTRQQHGAKVRCGLGDSVGYAAAAADAICPLILHCLWVCTWTLTVSAASLLLLLCGCCCCCLSAAAADAVRPFILHSSGGVYLDLDSECFSSMEPWLAGAQVALQAEVVTLPSEYLIMCSALHSFFGVDSSDQWLDIAELQ
jgi:hypothetical protein